MPAQKRYEQNLGTRRMRAFSSGVEIFETVLIIANVSFPQSSWGGEDSSLHHLLPAGAAHSPMGKAPHGGGVKPSIPTCISPSPR